MRSASAYWRAVFASVRRRAQETAHRSAATGSAGGVASSSRTSPASADSLITNPQPATSQDVKDAVDEASDGEKLFSTATDAESNADRLGFKFPIFDNPASLFGLLLGSVDPCTTTRQVGPDGCRAHLDR